MNKKMRLGLDVLVYIMQLLLITGAGIVQFFSTRRMGMMRYLVYKNQKWAFLFTAEMMMLYKTIWIILAAAFLVLIIRKRKQIKGYYRWINMVLLLFLLVMAGWYVFMGDAEKIRGLYYLLLAFGISIIVQFIRVAASFKN